MKKFIIPFKDCGVDGFDLLESTCFNIDVVDNGQFWMADYATGCRILSNEDILELTVTPEQETVLKLRFGDKISELV